MKNNMTIKMISRFSQVLLIMVFAVGVLNIQFLEPTPTQAEEIPKEIPGVMPGGAGAACGEDEFRACMEGKTSEVTVCGAACPLVEKPCQPGDPPGATCYGYDMSCLNACSSAAEQICRTKTTCPPETPKSSPTPTPITTTPPTAILKWTSATPGQFVFTGPGGVVYWTESGEIFFQVPGEVGTYKYISLPGWDPVPTGEFNVTGPGGVVYWTESGEIFFQTPGGQRQKYTILPPLPPTTTTPPTTPQPTISQPKAQEAVKDDPFEFVKDPLENAFTEETESLADTKPQKTGQFKEEWERLRALRPPPEGNDWPVYVLAIDGDGRGVEVQTEGRKDWTGVSGGDIIPETGGYIQTDFDTEVTLVMPDGSIITIGELSQVQLDLRPRPLGAKLELKLGDMNLDINPGTFSADMQIRAGNNTGAVRGTHFGVAYNPDTDVAVYEIYDGTINVTSDKTGKTVALSSSYDKPIKRVEIPKSGEFVYKTAIPKDEWQAREAAGDTNNRFSWYIIGAVAAALFIAIFFVLQRKGIVRSKHGFVNVVLIITMAMLIGAVGYIVVTKNRSAPVVPSQTSVDATQTANPTSTPDQSSPINKIANWKLYRNDEYGFEFRYPEDVRLDINREDSLRVFKNFDRKKDTWNESRTKENIQRINIAEYIRIYEKYGPNPVFSVQTIGANKSIIMEGAWLTIDHCGTRFGDAETVTFMGYKAEKAIDHLEVFGENGPYIAEELFQYCLNYPLSPIIIDFHSDIGELIFSTFKFIK